MSNLMNAGWSLPIHKLNLTISQYLNDYSSHASNKDMQQSKRSRVSWGASRGVTLILILLVWSCLLRFIIFPWMMKNWLLAHNTISRYIAPCITIAKDTFGLKFGYISHITSAARGGGALEILTVVDREGRGCEREPCWRQQTRTILAVAPCAKELFMEFWEFWDSENWCEIPG
jgi:hypothetical protein